MALANALRFFGGVPQAIVPDKRNAARLKSAVKKAHRYEPDLNRDGGP